MARKPKRTLKEASSEQNLYGATPQPSIGSEIVDRLSRFVQTLESRPADSPQRITLNVALLEAVRERKENYLDPVTVESCQNFLAGFSLACSASGIDDGIERILAAQAGRGWTVEACGPVPEMREQGLSDEQIMDELITIHITAFRDQDKDGPALLSGHPRIKLS